MTPVTKGVVARDSRSTLADFVEMFLAAKRLSEDTRLDYRRYLRQFDMFTRESSLEDALTLDNASRWVAQLATRGQSTAVNGARALQSLASWLADTRYLLGPGEMSVLARLRVPKADVKKRLPLTPLQLEEIWAALAERPGGDQYRALAFLRLVHATGMRRGEARALLLNDLRLNKTHTGGSVIFNSRGKKLRRDLDRKTAHAIGTYLSQERPTYRAKVPEPLFLSEEGKPLTKNGFGTWLDRVWRDIEELTPSGITASSEYMRTTWQQEAAEPIRDPVLRRRCEKFLRAVDDHDQAVREACLVLEDRVRERSGATNDDYGTALMDMAFGGEAPSLRLAVQPREQEGARSIFRGVIAFYRNGTSHRVRDDFDPNEAMRVVALVDHLLWMIDQRTL